MKKLLITALALALTGCLFPAPPPRHSPPPEPEHQPGPTPRTEEPEPPPPGEPEVPEHTRASAPPADPASPPPAPPAAPTLNIRVVPAEARPGQVVELHLDPPGGAQVKVFWKNQVIPKETVGTKGAVIRVRIPGDARGNGQFHLEWRGKRFDSPMVTVRR